MANEITYSISLSFTKATAKDSLGSSGNISVSGSKFVHAVQSIGTSDEALGIGEITTPGVVMARNIDSTNYVELGADGTNYVVKLLAGESAFFRIDGTAIHAKANTAACLVEFLVIDN